MVSGECRGIITTAPRGNNGFGYDPVFYLPELDKTMAELTLEEKNKVSHRAKAAEKAVRVLKRLHQEIDR
jgi:XTP/dITP diphosphohydrolase